MAKTEEKPQRLYFKSYLKIIENSVSSNIFRNFYAKTSEKGEFDAFGGGDVSCAFFVSTILVIFKKIDAFHGLVSSTIEDMEKSGWIEVKEPKSGDVMVWEPMKGADDPRDHIGFYMGNGQAISNSSKKKSPQKHEMHYGDLDRKITAIYRMESWDDKS